MIVRMVIVAVLACFAGGCQLLETTPDELSFKYRPFGGDDMMDQVLEITNDGPGAVVPTLAITPLNEAGLPIDGLKVTTAYGSERGGRVLPPYFTDIDVLKFEGARAGEVRDVRVKVKALEQVDYPEIDEGITSARFDDGREVTAGDETFDEVELTNPNEDDVTVRIALIGWAAAPEGQPQQAEWVIPFSDELVTVPARGRKRLPMPEDLADRLIVSVKPFAAR